MKFIINIVLCLCLVFSVGIAKETVQIKPKEKTTVIKRGYHFYTVTLTAYSPNRGETDSTPNETAILEKPIPGRTVAVSRDLLGYLGSKVYIYQVGVFRVNDLMNPRYEKRIDICLGKNEAKKFGIKKNIRVVFFDR